MEQLVKFASGATRSSDRSGVRYDLITPIGLRRLAETYAEGAKKHGDNNWLKGFPASDTLNHVLAHLNMWKTGDASEDHLAHAAWGLFAIMHFEETRPELIDVAFRKTLPTVEECEACSKVQVSDPLADTQALPGINFQVTGVLAPPELGR